MSRLDVLRAPGLVTVQDRGRRGLAHLGIPPSGALDWPAFALANRLVGNPEDAAGLETTLGGVALRASDPCTIAVTGAIAPVEIGGRPAAINGALHLRADDELRVGAATHGVRNYVAIRGGLIAPTTMGSAATDVLTGLGPPPVRPGDVLAIGTRHASWPPVETAPAPAPAADVLPIVVGPRHDWFEPRALTELTQARFRVSPASNRIGLRLDGPTLARARVDELRSEGVVTGAIQVPPSGQPIILLNDHPTTGGYPVIAVVRRDALSRLAQLRPGGELRFAVAVSSP